MATQSIIVYRNPVEAALYEGQWAEYLVPAGVASLVALFVFLAVNWLSETVVRKLGRSPYQYRTAITVNATFWSSVAFVLTITRLWI